MSLKPKAVDFEKTWTPLKDSILKIVTLQPIDRKLWNDHFYDIYAFCIAIPKCYGADLYNETKKCLEKHVELLSQEVTKSGEETFLETYYKSWTAYHKGSEYIDKLFRYLNNQIIKKQKYSEADITYGGVSVDQVRSSMLDIGELSLDIWRRIMIVPIETNLIQLLLQAIDKDRKKVNVQDTIVQGVILSLVEVEQYKLKGMMDFYQNLFESKFLECTSEHYKRHATNLLQTSSCSQYMEKVLAVINEENLRSRKFLHPSSFEKVTNVCEKVMVESQMEFLQSMTRTMVQNEQLTDLANMYVLEKPLKSGLKVLVKEFENYVKQIALDCVKSLKGDSIPIHFTEGILNIHRRFSKIILTVFQNDKEFVGGLDQACVTAVNFKEDSNSCPKASEWVAKYADYLLRKSSKSLTENELEEKLSSAILVFRYIEDKDIFQKFYAHMLAQRLIHELSVTMDAEESMIAKLKSACGYEFTTKFQRMYTDVTLSRDLTKQFIASVEAQRENMDLSVQVQVLQAGAWPLTSSQTTPFVLPREFEKSVSLFEKFYNTKFTGRKLYWLYNWATADVKLNYLPRSYIATMTVHQAAVLLCFNGLVSSNVESCTVEDIENASQLKNDLLYKNIKSLIDSGLLKSPQDNLINSTQLFINKDFSSKRSKFKLSIPAAQKQVEKEVDRVNSTVQQDRKYFLDCAIVRIMKSRKVLKQNQLIQEVISLAQSRFAPEIPFIKKVIEQLIEKQYLQRTENADELAYLA